jgi:tetratricopeptide (TPR) repeat protein
MAQSQSDAYLQKIGISENGTQSKVTSEIIDQLADKANDTMSDDLETSARYARLSLQLAKKIDHKTGELRSLLLLSKNMVHSGESDSSIYFTELVLQQAKTYGDSDYQVGGHNRLGTIHALAYRFSDATEEYYKALKLAEATNSKRRINTYYNLGWIYHRTGNPAKSREYLTKVLDLPEEAGHLEIAKALSLLGVIEKNDNNWNKALEYYEKTLKIAQKHGAYALESETYYNLAQVSFNSGNTDQGLSYELAALEISKNIDDERSIAVSYHGLANTYLEHFKNNELSTAYLDSALLYLKGSTNYQVYNAIYAMKWNMATTNGNYEEALQYATLCYEYYDSLSAEQIKVATDKQEEK